MDKVLNNLNEYFEKLDTLYPDRHKKIHTVCCKNCPSDDNKKNFIEDEESKDIKEGFTKEIIATEFLFVCAWRNSKLCKGLCDYMEIDQNFLDNLNVTHG